MSIFNALLTDGLELETGTWTPTNNTSRGEISFTNEHSTPPAAFIIYDTGETTPPQNSCVFDVCFDYESLFGEAVSGVCSEDKGSKFVKSYASSTYQSARRALIHGASDSDDSTESCYRYYATESRIYPFHLNSFYWRKTRTYKWIAIWT